MASQVRWHGGIRRIQDAGIGIRERQAQEIAGRSPPGHPRLEERVWGKALAPQAKREAIRKMIELFDLSERRACRLVGLSRDSYRHEPEVSAQPQALCGRIVEIAHQRRRFGYTSKRLRTVTDSDGIHQTVEVSKRVKPIWFTQNNKVFVQVRYGSKVIPLTTKGDKNSVEVASAEDLIDVLKKLDQAVLGGELDSQIEIASEGVRARFTK